MLNHSLADQFDNVCLAENKLRDALEILRNEAQYIEAGDVYPSGFKEYMDALLDLVARSAGMIGEWSTMLEGKLE